MRSVVELVVFACTTGPALAQLCWWWPPQAWYPCPLDREGQVVVYDVARRVTVLFGGYQVDLWNQYQHHNDTWLWDGVHWQLAASAGPPGAPGVCGAYDNLRHCLVLRTGAATWEWDGSTWQQRVAGSPPARSGDKMAFDRLRGECVLFGTDRDTWTWNGQSWTQHANSAASGMVSIGLAYDPVRQRVLRCGGVQFVTQFATWTWDGALWHLENPATGPGGRRGFSLFDDGSRVLLYGGDLGVQFAFRDLWAWNGTGWQLVTTVGSGPAASNLGCAYDLLRRRVVLTTGRIGLAGQFSTGEFFEPSTTTPGLESLGSGGPAPGGKTMWLTLVEGDWPAVGSSVRLRVVAAPVPAAAPPPSWLAFSTNSSTWGGSPLPRDLGALGAPGAVLWIDPMAWLPMVGSPPTANVAIPDDPGLLGFELAMQGLVPLPGFNALAATTTNGLRVRVGRL
jgi:hypothetical protein